MSCFAWCAAYPLRDPLAREVSSSAKYQYSGLVPSLPEKLPGTLRFTRRYGVGNPRDFFSSKAPSLLKFQSLKLKGVEENRRGELGTQQGSRCVADSEHLSESTGSTGQVWSTNFGTQPLTISCGFPAPCLLEMPRVPCDSWGIVQMHW